MSEKAGFVGHRKAFIHTVNGDGTYDIFYSDDNSNNIIKGVNAVNVGSFGSGVFNRYHEGAPVWIGQSYYYQPLIVGFADMPGSIEQGDILASDDIDAPLVEPGEMVIQASSGAHMDFRKTGDIKISNLKDDGIFLSDAHRSLLFTSYQHYNINDSGYTIEGRVRRFDPNYVPGHTLEDGTKTPVFTDLLTDPEADAFTVDVARDPSQKALSMNRARGGAGNVIRNPAFAEKREVVLEFADSFFVRDPQIETELASEFPKTLDQMSHSVARRRGYGTNEQTFDNLRHSSRTNLLKLDSNVIIERVQGTLVDIFGNVLDINYNKLNLPKTSDSGVSVVPEIHSLLNRSVAYHFQVNARNSGQNINGNGKFTFDIDKEGQFKLNVPRSSVSGTTSTISVFDNNSTDVGSRVDVNNTQLSKSNIQAPTGGNAGTAFHNMTLVADRLIRNSVKTINPIRQHSNTTGVQANGDTPNVEFIVTDKTTSNIIPQFTTTISVQQGIPAISSKLNKDNAGGHSGQINFEGSLEVSIGKDNIDEKSLMLDTAGSLIAWFGIDNHGRSVVANADGAILLNIGDYILDKDSNPVFNPGTLAIRVNLIDEKAVIEEIKPETLMDNKKTSDHILYFGPRGLIVASGNGTPIVFRSSGDMLFEAAGTIDFKGKNIQMDAGNLRTVSTKKGDI